MDFKQKDSTSETLAEKYELVKNLLFDENYQEVLNLINENNDFLNEYILLLCCYYGYPAHVDLLKVLLNHGTKVKPCAISCACKFGHLEIIQTIFERINIHRFSDLAMRISSQYGKIRLVAYLYSKGANIHNIDEYALRWSVINGHFHIVRFLVEHGANTHVQQDYPLRWSIKKKHARITFYLISKMLERHENVDINKDPNKDPNKFDKDAKELKERQSMYSF
jgi:ankyrin repeat protein